MLTKSCYRKIFIFMCQLINVVTLYNTDIIIMHAGDPM